MLPHDFEIGLFHPGCSRAETRGRRSPFHFSLGKVALLMFSIDALVQF